MRRKKQFYIYLIITIILISCVGDKEPIPEEPLGQVKLNFIADRDITGEKFDLEIIDKSGTTIESITNISEPPEYLELEDGAYKIYVSSQNQEITNFSDVVFNGFSNLFEISHSDTLEVSINLIFDQPLGQVNLNLIADKDITGEEFDIEILDTSGTTIKSITSILESPEYITLEDGNYKISISSQNQEITNFGDVVFNGVSDLFEISHSDTLEVSINLIFELPLGQIKIELSGLDIGNTSFSLITLDADSSMVEIQSELQEISPYLALETGSYQYAVQSSLRSYTTVEDFVFSGYSQEFSINKGDTLVVDINLGLDARKGWISVPNVPIGKRFAPSSFIIGNNVYLGFGSSFSNERFQDWWVYSIENNSWRQLEDFPGGKRFASLSFSIGNKGYVCLGYDELTSTLTELWRFDSETESWSKLNDFPGVARSRATAFVIGDKAYIGSGIANGITSLNDFHVYDATNNSWSTIPDYNGNATYGFTSFSIDEDGYLIGGVINNDERTNRHIVFNSNSETWNDLPSFPGTARLEGLGFTIDGKGYFGLGSIDNNTAGTDLWVYNPLDATWQEATSFVGESRFSTVHGSNGSLGYFGFGQKGNTEYNDLYLYYPTN